MDGVGRGPVVSDVRRLEVGPGGLSESAVGSRVKPGTPWAPGGLVGVDVDGTPVEDLRRVKDRRHVTKGGHRVPSSVSLPWTQEPLPGIRTWWEKFRYKTPTGDSKGPPVKRRSFIVSSLSWTNW